MGVGFMEATAAEMEASTQTDQRVRGTTFSSRSAVIDLELDVFPTDSEHLQRVNIRLPVCSPWTWSSYHRGSLV